MGVKIIEDPPEETLTETSRIVKVATILLYITTAFGGLFLVVMSSILLCFLVRKCQVDWYLPQDYDDVEENSINHIDARMITQNDSAYPLASQSNRFEVEPEPDVDVETIRNAT